MVRAIPWRALCAVSLLANVVLGLALWKCRQPGAAPVANAAAAGSRRADASGAGPKILINPDAFDFSSTGLRDGIWRLDELQSPAVPPGAPENVGAGTDFPVIPPVPTLEIPGEPPKH
jgi:hypothetical protein